MKIKLNTANIFLAFILLSFVQAPLANAAIEDEESYSSYESIVQELTSSRSQQNRVAPLDPMEMIRFHASLGWVSSRLALNLPAGLPNATTMTGIETRFGIDLFSPYWIAEGAIRSFNPENINEFEMNFREFDLLVNNRNVVSRSFSFLFGAGLSARYLDFSTPPPGFSKANNTTPASVLTVGLSTQITKVMTFDAALSYRKALVQDTADSGAVDGVFRLSGHF